MWKESQSTQVIKLRSLVTELGEDEVGWTLSSGLGKSSLYKSRGPAGRKQPSLGVAHRGKCAAV